MKKRRIRMLGFVFLVMLLVGCGSATETSEVGNQSAALGGQESVSGVIPKDSEAETQGNESEEKKAEIKGSETKAATQSNKIKETQAATQSNKAKETKAAEEIKSKEALSGKSFISEAEAREIARKDAGVKEKDIADIRVKLEKDDGIWEYEVEFYAGNQEYDYEIHAETGKILNRDMEIEEDFYFSKKIDSSDKGERLSKEDVKQLILKKVPGASEQEIRLHLDYEDGAAVYEGSLVHKGIEYDFELDAKSGVILEWEQERED